MKTGTKILLTVIIIAILGVAWWLASPLFIQTTKNEPAPEVQAENTNTAQAVDDKETGTASADADEEDEKPLPEIESVKGAFTGEAHEVRGNARVILSETGKVLRFEDFYTDNGPDLRVYLATDSSAKDFIDLGELPATSGNYNIELPDSIDLEKYNTVIVWCRTFRVNFGYAQLADPGLIEQ